MVGNARICQWVVVMVTSSTFNPCSLTVSALRRLGSIAFAPPCSLQASFCHFWGMTVAADGGACKDVMVEDNKVDVGLAVVVSGGAVVAGRRIGAVELNSQEVEDGVVVVLGFHTSTVVVGIRRRMKRKVRTDQAVCDEALDDG